jgi:hypothetical protein
MSEIDLQRELRHRRKPKKLKGTYCIVCGETDICCLQSVTLCAECRLKLQGLPTVEKHHVFGRKYDPFTVEIPANEHAIISDMEIESNVKKSKNKILILLYAISILLDRLIELIEGGNTTPEGDNE